MSKAISHKRKIGLLQSESSSEASDQEDSSEKKEQEFDHTKDEETFIVNEAYAKRFKHNKEREELHRLSEKYGGSNAAISMQGKQDGEDSEDDDSSSEDEDEEGMLTATALDQQYQNTLNAIRRKDARVYDQNTKFYSDIGSDEEKVNSSQKNGKQAKPMYLSDYHRINLLKDAGTHDPQEISTSVYEQEQEALKQDLVNKVDGALRGEAGGQSASDDQGDEEDTFLIPKPRQPQQDDPAISKKHVSGIDVAQAEANPDAFLEDFLAKRAWIPTESTRFRPLESDDDSDDDRADQYEEAYNLRFEDPEHYSSKLLSHSREAAAKYSVRKDSMKPRQKARALERIREEEARQMRETEKARLRKLKIAEAEDKLHKIREAAGLRAEAIDERDWIHLLESGWDDETWNAEMQKRFGDQYYASKDDLCPTNGKSSKKVKKPKWTDDIDIGDIVPDFGGNEPGPSDAQNDTLGDGESKDADNLKAGDEVDPPTANTGGITSHKPADRSARKRQARDDRQKIETIVARQMHVDDKLASYGKKHGGQFRYRETSPQAFGLTPTEILMASDSQLNSFVGLKKMAAFRDPDKKRKDKKRLGKKARLREWRKDTFGHVDGPQTSLAETLQRHEEATGPTQPSQKTLSKTSTSRKHSRRKKEQE